VTKGLNSGPFGNARRCRAGADAWSNAIQFLDERLLCRCGMARTREPSLRREHKRGATGSPERRYEPSGGCKFRWKLKDWKALKGASADHSSRFSGRSLRQFIGRMLGFLVSAIFIASGARADDVIFAAARLKAVEGRFLPIEASHLYRVGTDGTGLRQITFGVDSDTDPCVSIDGRRLLFWRRRDDLVGDVRLISAAFDGTDQRVLYRVTDLDLSSPTDLARVLAYQRRVKFRPDPDGDPRTACEMKASKKAGWQTIKGLSLSPSGRYLHCDTKEGTDVAIDLRSGKTISSVSGVWLDDRVLVWPSLKEEGWLEFSSIYGDPSREIDIHNVVNGKKVDCVSIAGSEREVDQQGYKAFRLGPSGKEVLLQTVWRSEAGGNPLTYGFSVVTGRVRFELKDLFLEGVDRSRAHFLTTTWKWGSGWNSDGAVPLRKLQIWDAASVKPKQLGFDLESCDGACFVPSAGAKR